MKSLAALAHYVRDNGGLRRSLAKVVRLSVKLLRQSGFRGLEAEVRQTLSIRKEKAEEARRARVLRQAAQSRKVVILTTPHVTYVAHQLQALLAEFGFASEIISTRPLRGYGKDLHIVLCPQMYSSLPRNLIAVQMEQSISERWFDQRYLGLLKDALAILDYSKNNILYLTGRGIPYQRFFYFPITMMPGYREKILGPEWDSGGVSNKAYDVLFYGDVNKPRRQQMLSQLKQHFNVKVIGNTFGEELINELCKSRVVVNIHYYDNALLETTRIHECLALGIPVVSESSVDIEDYPDLAPLVRFVPVGNVRAMIYEISQILDQPEFANAFDDQVRSAADRHLARSQYYFGRFLLANDLTTFEELTDRIDDRPAFSTGRLCLSLPETLKRQRQFLAQKLDGFEMFDGLRHSEGWIGCGMSYKFILSKAANRGIRRVLVCEDDMVLTAHGRKVLPIIDRYLDANPGTWDVFAGLIAHVDPDVEVTQVDEYEGVTFVHINKMTSMVFNIYNRSAFDIIARWDESNTDWSSNTIDRYLERTEGLRVIVALPFVVGHDEGATSTLWGFGNQQYASMIAESAEFLQQKLTDFNARHR